MHIKKYTWLFPFLCFFGGYFVVRKYVPVNKVSVPHLIGLNSSHALTIASQKNLFIKIVSQTVDNKLAENTIIWQTPSPEASIKEGQTIFCTICVPGNASVAPTYKNLTEHAIKKEQPAEYAVHTYQIPYTYKLFHCFGQFPAAATSISKEGIIAYIAYKPEQMVLMPNFNGMSVEHARTIIRDKSFLIDIYPAHQNPTHICKTCSIINQYPSARSTIDIDTLSHITLKVTHKD